MTHAFELVVLRHGRTAWNADGRFQGHTDVALDEVGREGARALERLLAGERFDFAVASDLQRAFDTAAIALGERELTVTPDPRWREMNFGAWEGLAWPQIVAFQPELAVRSSTKPAFYTPAGGESFDALCARVRDALAAIDARVRDGERVLVATHAGPLHALLRIALGEGEAAALGVTFSPASLTRLQFDAHGARLLELNRVAPEHAPL